MWGNMMPPRLVLVLWPVIDKILRMIYHIKPLRADGNGVTCFELRRYHGRPIRLDDGSEIKTGDKIIELHMNNAWFRKRHKLNLKASHLTWEVLGCFVQDLNFLAGQIAKGVFGGVTALHGSTLLHILARRLEFQVEKLPNTLWKKGAQFYMAGLMQTYYWGKEFKSRGKPLELKEVWLSKAELLRRYSKGIGEFNSTLGLNLPR